MSSVPALGQLERLVDARTLAILEQRNSSAVVRRRGWWVRRALATADVVGLAAAFLIAQWLYASFGPALREHDAVASAQEYGLFALSLPVWIVLAKFYGLYSRDEERTDQATSDDVARVFHLVTVVVWLLYVAAYMTHLFSPVPAKLLSFWALSIVCVVAGRAAARTFCRRRIEYLQNTIVVGAGDVGQMIARKLIKHPEYGINVVGFVDVQPKERNADLDHLPVLGDFSELLEIVRLLDVERVIFAFSDESHDEALELIDVLRSMDVQVDIVPPFFEGLGLCLQLHRLEGIPLLGLPRLQLARSSLVAKRGIDILVAVLGLLVGTPVLIMIAVWVKLDSPGPVLYASARIGRHGSLVRLFKFRTMRVTADLALEHLLGDPARRAEFEATHKFEEDPRVTRAGRVLRRLSLDELPQLINVLRGDLSLVGPRPITLKEWQLVRRSEFLDQGYWSISDLRPGITGYWQVNGRSAIDYRDRIRLDRAYLFGWSISLDMLILARTFRVLVSQLGAR